MPLLVPIHEPSRVVGACLGRFFSEISQSLVVATAFSLQFFDENFNVLTYSVSVGCSVASVSSIKDGKRDSVVVCLENGNVHIIKYSQENVCFVHELVFEAKVDKMEVICSNDDNTVVLVKTRNSQILVIRGGSAVKATLYGGRWGNIFDACIYGDIVCLIENDPSTTPQLGVYQLSTKGLVLKNKYALASMDPYNLLRICPIPDADALLVYDFEHIEKYNFDGECTHVGDMPAFCIAPISDGILICEKGGALYNYNHSSNTMREIGSTNGSPTNVIVRGNLAFSWGNGNPTQVFEVDTGTNLRSFPTLGPVLDIIPFLDDRPGRIVAFTSSIFPFESYDSAFSTLSRLDFAIPTTHVAAVMASINPTRIFRADDETLIFSNNNNSYVFHTTDEGMRQAESYKFFYMSTETIIGNSTFQICPTHIKTSSKSINRQVIHASVRADLAITSNLGDICIYDVQLNKQFTHTFAHPVTFVKFTGKYTVIGTDHSIYIAENDEWATMKECQYPGVTDVEILLGRLVVGDREGRIHVLESLKTHYTVNILHGPISLCKMGRSLVAHADKTLRLSVKNEHELGDVHEYSYELIQFNQVADLVFCVTEDLILTSRREVIDLWFAGNSDITAVDTVGTHESLDAMLKHGNNLISVTRDEEDYSKCLFHEWSQDLSKSKLLYTLVKPDELVEQILLVEFSGFSGLLVALNHTLKDSCQLLLIDLGNLNEEPRTVNIGMGTIGKMIPCNSGSSELAQIYLLSSISVSSVQISKDGFNITVLEKQVRMGRSFDVLGDRALLFDYFEKTELCSISSKTMKHQAWLEDTEETLAGLILPPSKTFNQTSYLIATEARRLYQFEADEQNSNGKPVRFSEKVTSICRVSYETSAPHVADALLGTTNGGIYAYFRLPSEVEGPLALLSSRAKDLGSHLCSYATEDSGLIYWPHIRDLDSKKLSRLCEELDVDKALIKGVRQSINAIVH